VRRADGQADKDGTVRYCMRETSDANAAGRTVAVSLWPTSYSYTTPQTRHETCVIAIHHYSLCSDCDIATCLWVCGASGRLYMVGNDAYHYLTSRFCVLVGDTAAREGRTAPSSRGAAFLHRCSPQEEQQTRLTPVHGDRAAQGAKALFSCVCPPTSEGVIIPVRRAFEAVPPPHVGATTLRRRSAMHTGARSAPRFGCRRRVHLCTAADTALLRVVRHPHRVLTGGKRAFRLYTFRDDRSRLPVRHGHAGRARHVHGMVYSLGSPKVRDRQTLVIIPTYNERDNTGPLAWAVVPALGMPKDGRRT
jgi:hypothetical protein